MAEASKAEKAAASNKRRASKPVEGKIANNEPVDTRKASAKSAGVGERTYDAGKLILDALPRSKDADGVECRVAASDLIRVRMDDKLSRIASNPEAFGDDPVMDLLGY